ncbi:hypothetical protein FQN57_005598 [Myotisia sp. PD_48]|nr:hypothetical protein FQN57_005598 [Myotisia sp. PD_48]
MHLVLVLLLLAVSLTSAAVPQPVDYSGYKVFRLPTEEKNVKEIQRIIKDLHLDTWKYPWKSGLNADIVVPGNRVDSFLKRIDGMERVVMHKDLGQSIVNESRFETYQAGAPNITWFNSYHVYPQHVTWLTDIQRQYSANSEVKIVGSTHEGRQISAIHLWGRRGKDINPVLVFQGTIHGREWISTMVMIGTLAGLLFRYNKSLTNGIFKVVEYIIWSFLSSNGSNADISAILDKYDIWAIPIANPDGFDYTTKLDRNWIKNRGPNTGSSCIGTDLNRNYPSYWSAPVTNPCDQAYQGRAQGDTAEIKALTSFIMSLRSERGIKLFVDWHAYGQLFLYPYAHTRGSPNNIGKSQKFGLAFTTALRKVSGTIFQTEAYWESEDLVYGSSLDWASDTLKSETSFTALLRDTGTYGMILPPAQILPSGQEVLGGLIAAIKQL